MLREAIRETPDSSLARFAQPILSLLYQETPKIENFEENIAFLDRLESKLKEKYENTEVALTEASV